jgi:hypothetical protein
MEMVNSLAKPNYKSMVVNNNNELGGNQDDSVEKSSKFLVNISGYYMAEYDVLDNLRTAILERIDRGVRFRELLMARLSNLERDIDTPIGQDGQRFIADKLKPQLKELATMLDNATFEPIHGGRRNFRRYSRRKRR